MCIENGNPSTATAGRAGSRSLDATVADPDRQDDAAAARGPSDPAEDPTLRRPPSATVANLPPYFLPGKPGERK